MVKTTLMQGWNGLRTTSDRVVVIASTDHQFDLDEALLRRLPRRIMVDLPDPATRKEILKVSLANNQISADVTITLLAATLEGYSGLIFAKYVLKLWCECFVSVLGFWRKVYLQGSIEES